jgi:predicted NBD/HSP70 family sugar kinase
MVMPQEGRKRNEKRILNFLLGAPESTHVEIAKGVGLSREWVVRLIGSDSASEGRDGRLHGVLDVSDDRPPKFSIPPGLGCVIAIDMGARHVRARIADLALKELDRAESPAFDVIGQPHKALDEAAKLTQKMMKQVNGDDSKVAGLAVGVPFPYDKDAQRLIASGEWEGVSLPGDLFQAHRRAGYGSKLLERTIVGSDAQFGAMAELNAAIPYLEKLAREHTDLLYVKWSTRIGAAIIAKGEFYGGFRGLAGQFAHTPLRHQRQDAPECEQCGHVCLNSQVSLDAIAKRLKITGDDLGRNAEERAQALIEHAHDPDSAVKKVLDDAARKLGRALGATLNTLNSRVVIVGGAFRATDYQQHLDKPLREGIRDTAYGPLLEHVDLWAGRRTGEAAVVGGLAEAVRAYAASYLRDLSLL